MRVDVGDDSGHLVMFYASHSSGSSTLTGWIWPRAGPGAEFGQAAEDPSPNAPDGCPPELQQEGPILT
jgi:hypothetical protein